MVGQLGIKIRIGGIGHLLGNLRSVALALFIKESKNRRSLIFVLSMEEDASHNSDTLFENYLKYHNQILTFFSNFCTIKTDMSGNTV